MPVHRMGRELQPQLHGEHESDPDDGLGRVSCGVWPSMVERWQT